MVVSFLAALWWLVLFPCAIHNDQFRFELQVFCTQFCVVLTEQWILWDNMKDGEWICGSFPVKLLQLPAILGSRNLFAKVPASVTALNGCFLPDSCYSFLYQAILLACTVTSIMQLYTIQRSTPLCLFQTCHLPSFGAA